MAAHEAAKSGKRVLICEDGPRFWGWLNSKAMCRLTVRAHKDWIATTLAQLEAMENVTVLGRTSLFGYGDHNYLTPKLNGSQIIWLTACASAAHADVEDTGRTSHSGDRGD